MTHTQGEWKVATEKEWDTAYYGKATKFKAIIADGNIIAQTYQHGKEPYVSNARLIAAAPVMLEALKSSLDWTEAFDGSQESLETMRNHIREHLQQAITQAEAK